MDHACVIEDGLGTSVSTVKEDSSEYKWKHLQPFGSCLVELELGPLNCSSG